MQVLSSPENDVDCIMRFERSEFIQPRHRNALIQEYIPDDKTRTMLFTFPFAFTIPSYDFRMKLKEFIINYESFYLGET